MTGWTIQTLRDLDLRYAEEGLHPHQRSFHAARDILGDRFAIGVGGNPEVERITTAYEAMLPESSATWPGMGTGIAAVVDQVRRITAPVMFGTVRIPVWKGLGFDSDREWWTWCREDRQLASRTCFAFADILDLTYGLDDLKGSSGRGLPMWRMAASNVSDFANTLPSTFSVDSVVQPICLAVELSLKAAIVQGGEDPASFRKRGAEGHDLVRLASRVAREFPHRDDPQVSEISASMPRYVDSRYAPAGLTRLQVVRLALGAQFIAASSVRRHSARDLAAKMEQGGWPAPRPSPLT
ncbi:hypothetical protein [Methylorubrum extorquens]|uniref:HEPN domain-containing protein n=1 Tax=Methylorubrum extorquens TaxID=408 RepID=A0AAX3WFY0_METEX|nr:hypothetical protein [Methylorubrum extorquens]WHQ68864.1 hypothetical protein KEC54_21335 [Methylorubrum extorquens]